MKQEVQLTVAGIEVDMIGVSLEWKPYREFMPGMFHITAYGPGFEMKFDSRVPFQIGTVLKTTIEWEDS